MIRAAVWCFVLALTGGPALAAAQPPSRPAPPTAPQAPPAPLLEIDASETRLKLRDVLQRYPPDLGRILKMDPALMLDQAYMARYPALASFLQAHPEIARNPGYYLEFVRISSDYTRPEDPRDRAIDMWRNAIEGFTIMIVVVFAGAMFLWLVRTALDHRRWLRATTVQTDMHNKLLDRFAGTQELLAYVQSPAGRRFLEAAPIITETGGRPTAAPLNRILWSVQAGVVLVAGGLGFQFVSGSIIEEVAQGLWMIGVVGAAFGAGFILSGAVSYVLSRRLGLLDQPPLPETPRSDTTAV